MGDVGDMKGLSGFFKVYPAIKKTALDHSQPPSHRMLTERRRSNIEANWRSFRKGPIFTEVSVLESIVFCSILLLVFDRTSSHQRDIPTSINDLGEQARFWVFVCCNQQIQFIMYMDHIELIDRIVCTNVHKLLKDIST